MVRRVGATVASAVLLLGLFSGTALAGNPSGSGQPNASCEDALAVPPAGFGKDGFAKAELRYAGSDGTHSADHANSDNAVSQYDVACYQLGLPH
jgi:hypothetical protein